MAKRDIQASPESEKAARSLKLSKLLEGVEEPSLFIARSNTEPYISLDEEDKLVGKLARESEIVSPDSMGAVRTLDLLEHLSQYSPTCLHYLGHGSIKDIKLNDKSLDADALARLIANSGVRFVFLNCCRSFKLAKKLHEIKSVSVVIATSSQLPNEVAKEFARAVWFGLLKGKKTIWAATQMANAVLPAKQRDQYHIYCKLPSEDQGA